MASITTFDETGVFIIKAHTHEEQKVNYQI